MARTKNAAAVVVVNRRGRPANVIVRDGNKIFSVKPDTHQKLLQSVAKGRKPNLTKLGAKPIGEITTALDVLTAEDAEKMLTPGGE
jgi:hypothetical protein